MHLLIAKTVLVCPSSLEWKKFLTIAVLHCASFVQSRKKRNNENSRYGQKLLHRLIIVLWFMWFESTNDCITVDLSCFCAIQCIADVDLQIVNK